MATRARFTRAGVGVGTAAALGIGLAVGLGSVPAASGAPIRFDNLAPGELGRFEWTLAPGYHPPPRVLDVTKPYDQQTSLRGLPGTFEQSFYIDDILPLSYSSMNLREPFNNEMLSGYGLAFYADPLAAGTLISAALPFDATFSGTECKILYQEEGLYKFDIPENVPTYLGVRWYDGAVTTIRYGWIEVVRAGYYVDARSWGYETDAGVPIVVGTVPEPATLGASGALALVYFRKRSGHRRSAV